MKKCFKCLKEKDLSDFYVHKKMADGHLGKCKECTKRDVMEYRSRNLESIQAYDRKRGRLPHRKEDMSKRQKKNRLRHNELNRAYSEKYKDRKMSHTIISNQRRDGKIIPKPCEVCGGHDRIQAHHPDYSKPLEIVWLCQPHHMELHRRYA